MGAFAILAHAYAHNKNALPYDRGQCYDPMGKEFGNKYQATGIVTEHIRYENAVESGRRCQIELSSLPIDQDPRIGDTFYLTGATGNEGEFVITAVNGTDLNLWRYTDAKNPANGTGSPITTDLTGLAWIYYAPTAKGDIYVDPQRVISHPSFTQVEGQGIYTYPFNPVITKNFVYHPSTKVDGVVQRTLSSNIFVARPQVPEDVIITEIWTGGEKTLSTLREMFQTFYTYWTTIPDAGESLGWEPRDRTSDRFLIQVVRVQLGGVEFDYKEVRQDTRRYQDAYLSRQLTLQFKLARRIIPPLPQLTLEGR